MALKRLSQKWVVALGSGLIGLSVIRGYVAESTLGVGLDMWRTESIWLAIWVMISAGTGGYLCHHYFDRQEDRIWKRACITVLGMFQITILGAAISGFGMTIAMGGGYSLLAPVGAIFGPVIVLSVLAKLPTILLIWMLGFGILEIIVRKFCYIR